MKYKALIIREDSGAILPYMGVVLVDASMGAADIKLISDQISTRHTGMWVGEFDATTCSSGDEAVAELSRFVNQTGGCLGAQLGAAPEILPPKYDIVERDRLLAKIEELSFDPTPANATEILFLEAELERMFGKAYGGKNV